MRTSLTTVGTGTIKIRLVERSASASKLQPWLFCKRLNLGNQMFVGFSFKVGNELPSLRSVSSGDIDSLIDHINHSWYS